MNISRFIFSLCISITISMYIHERVWFTDPQEKKEREREGGTIEAHLQLTSAYISRTEKGYFYTTFLMRSFWNFPILTSFSTAVCIIVLILIPYYYFHQPFALSFTQKAVYIHHDVVKVLEAFLTACKLSTQATRHTEGTLHVHIREYNNMFNKRPFTITIPSQ